VIARFAMIVSGPMMSPRIARMLPLVFALAGWSAVGLAGAEPAEKPAPVGAMREVVAEWARVRSEAIHLEESWRWERELLRSTQRALQQQVAKLEDESKALDASTSAERASLAEIAARNAAAEASLKAAGQRLQAISEQLRALRSWLPPRLSLALELPYRSLANPALGPTERMQYVTTVLNRCTQFDRTITYGEEVLAEPGEPEGRMVEAIYWGVSHAYALDRTAGRAYFGSPGPRGWAWEPDPALVRPVTQLIAIYRDKADPETVAVPVRLSAARPN
jgi:Skp family chaperone for outer membrane proteins